MYLRTQFARPLGGTYITRPPLRRRRLRSLGALLAVLDPSVESIFPAVTKTAGFTATDKQKWESAVEARFLPDYYRKAPGDCESPSKVSTGALTPTLSVTSKAAGGLAPVAAGSSSATFAAAAAPLAIAGAVIGVAALVIGIFKAHHAKAVALEQNTLCVAVPAANEALSQVDDALRSAQLTSSQASQGYDQILSSFVAYVKQIIKDNPSQCNAACVYGRMLRGIVAQRKLDLQVSPPPAEQGASASAAAAAGLPAWALYAAGAALLYSLL